MDNQGWIDIDDDDIREIIQDIDELDNIAQQPAEVNLFGQATPDPPPVLPQQPPARRPRNNPALNINRYLPWIIPALLAIAAIAYRTPQTFELNSEKPVLHKEQNQPIITQNQSNDTETPLPNNLTVNNINITIVMPNSDEPVAPKTNSVVKLIANVRETGRIWKNKTIEKLKSTVDISNKKPGFLQKAVSQLGKKILRS